MDLDAKQLFAEALARDAGELLRRYRRDGFDVARKGAIDLVTSADHASEHLIADAIAKRFPSHGIVGEEGGDRQAPPAGDMPVWIVDPIDGTTDFVHGFPVYCVSLALYADGAAQVGVVYDPTRDELFSARRGGGATLNGTPIAVSGTVSLIESLMTSGFPYDLHETGGNLDAFLRLSLLTRGVRISGSAALDLCWTACGRLDAYWEPAIKPWDGAAGALIVREAGGRVTDYAARAWQPGIQEVVASNGALHPDLLRELSAE